MYRYIHICIYIYISGSGFRGAINVRVIKESLRVDIRAPLVDEYTVVPRIVPDQLSSPWDIDGT